MSEVKTVDLLSKEFDDRFGHFLEYGISDVKGYNEAKAIFILQGLDLHPQKSN